MKLFLRREDFCYNFTINTPIGISSRFSTRQLGCRSGRPPPSFIRLKAHEEREIEWGDRCFCQRIRPYYRYGSHAAYQLYDVKSVHLGILVCVRHDTQISISFMNQRLCLAVDSFLDNLHLLAIPMFNQDTAVNQVYLITKVMDVTYFG